MVIVKRKNYIENTVPANVFFTFTVRFAHVFVPTYRSAATDSNLEFQF